jgi:hypothetical protein
MWGSGKALEKKFAHRRPTTSRRRRLMTSSASTRRVVTTEVMKQSEWSQIGSNRLPGPRMLLPALEAMSSSSDRLNEKDPAQLSSRRRVPRTVGSADRSRHRINPRRRDEKTFPLPHRLVVFRWTLEAGCAPA